MNLFTSFSAFISLLFVFCLKTTSLRNQQNTIDNLCFINFWSLDNKPSDKKNYNTFPTKLASGLKKYEQTPKEKSISYWKRVDPSINKNLPSLKPLKTVQNVKSSFTNTKILPRLSSIDQKFKTKAQNQVNYWNLKEICYKDLLQLLTDLRELLYFFYEETLNLSEVEILQYIKPLEKLARIECDLQSLKILLKKNLPPPSQNVKSYILSIKERKKIYPIAILTNLYYFCKEWSISGPDTLNYVLKILKIPKTLKITRWDQDVINLEMTIDNLALEWGESEKTNFLRELEIAAANSIKLVGGFKR